MRKKNRGVVLVCLIMMELLKVNNIKSSNALKSVYARSTFPMKFDFYEKASVFFDTERVQSSSNHNNSIMLSSKLWGRKGRKAVSVYLSYLNTRWTVS